MALRGQLLRTPEWQAKDTHLVRNGAFRGRWNTVLQIHRAVKLANKSRDAITRHMHEQTQHIQKQSLAWFDRSIWSHGACLVWGLEGAKRGLVFNIRQIINSATRCSESGLLGGLDELLDARICDLGTNRPGSQEGERGFTIPKRCLPTTPPRNFSPLLLIIDCCSRMQCLDLSSWICRWN